MKQHYSNILILLSVLLCLMSWSCREEDQQSVFKASDSTARVQFDALSDQPLVEYILNPRNEESENCHLHIRKTLDYAKIPFRSYFIEGF